MTVKVKRVPFEEALNMTGYGRYNVCLCLICSSAIIGMIYELFGVSYLVVSSACELHTTSVQQGLIACIPLAGVIAASQLWGYLADTRGRRKMLLVSMSMGYIASVLATFSPNWIVLFILKFCSSASVAGAFALALTLLSEGIPSAKRSPLVLLSNTISLMSTGSMAAIAIPVLPLTFSYYVPFLGIFFNSWRLLNLLFATPCLIGVIGVACAYESPKYLLTVGRKEEALEVLRGMYVKNSGKSADNYQVDELIPEEDTASTLHMRFFKSITIKTIPLFKPPFLKHTILLSIISIIIYICINSFAIWLPFMANAFITAVLNGDGHLSMCDMIRIANNATLQESNESCAMNSLAMTVAGLIMFILAICNGITSVMVNYFSRKKIFIGIQMVTGIAAIGINDSPYWILTAVLFMIYLIGACNVGLVSTYPVDIYPTSVKAMAVCISLMVGRGGAMFGINILKYMLVHDCDNVFYVFGAAACLAGVIGFLLPSEAQLKKHKESLSKIQL